MSDEILNTETMRAFADKAKKAADAVKAYLDNLSELDSINMKATVAMFTKDELKAMASRPENSEQTTAFMQVALFLKGIQNVGQ